MSDDLVDDVDDGALFGVDELLVDVEQVGRCEAGTWHALKRGAATGVVIDLDSGLAAVALATARRLDEAERLGRLPAGVGLKAGYLYAQLVPPYRELMQALRLPAAVEPAEEPRTPTPTGDGSVPAWVHDAVGTPEHTG